MTKISRGVGRRNQLEFLLALTPPGAPLFLREAERAICGSDPRTIAARPSLAPSLQPRTNPWIGAGGRVRSKWRARSRRSHRTPKRPIASSVGQASGAASISSGGGGSCQVTVRGIAQLSAYLVTS